MERRTAFNLDQWQAAAREERPVRREYDETPTTSELVRRLRAKALAQTTAVVLPAYEGQKWAPIEALSAQGEEILAACGRDVLEGL